MNCYCAETSFEEEEEEGEEEEERQNSKKKTLHDILLFDRLVKKFTLLRLPTI